MDAATKGGLFTGGCGLIVLAITFAINENPFALFTGLSYTGTPIIPIVGVVFGPPLVLCGILSVIGVLPERYEWHEEQ
jgi:hypothetical protein